MDGVREIPDPDTDADADPKESPKPTGRLTRLGPYRL